MKNIKLLASTAFLMIATNLSAQVGVNTTTPNSTMDVSAKRDSGGNITDNTQIFGLQAPRLTRAELTANTAMYGANQRGAQIYITDVSGGDTSGQRTNIDAIGYYFFDGSVWKKMVSDNIYNADGTVTNTRTVTLNGNKLSFLGSTSKTSVNDWGSLSIEGLSPGSNQGAMNINASDGDGNGVVSSLQVEVFSEGTARIHAVNDTKSLTLGTSGNLTSAPIIFNTAPGASVNGSERMRITGEGNVGISTNNPQVTLDVAGSPATAAILDGIRAPRLTGSQMRAKTYTTSQLAAIVYATAADTAPAGQTINVTSAGYYYFDGTAWQRMKVNDINIYNNDGALTSGRTLSNNGFSLTFAGTNQSSIWSSTGSFNQRGFAGGKRSSIIIASDDNNSNGINSNLQLFQDPENLGQILAGNDSQGLSLGTSYTSATAPIIFMTSAGSSAVGTEKMRITGAGNVGIGTSTPQKQLHVNGSMQLTNELNVGGNSGTAGSAGTSGQILTSNGAGQAPSWSTPRLETINGILPTSTVTVTPGNGNVGTALYSGANITLPPGKWAIAIGSVFRTADLSTVTTDTQYWAHAYIRDSSTGSPGNSPDIISGTGISAAGSISRGGTLGMITGTILINNTGTVNKTYYIWVDAARYGANASATFSQFFSDSAFERWFYASAINNN